MLGLEPHVEVSVQSFQLLPALVAGTRRVALIQRRLARPLGRIAPVRTLPCPFEAVSLHEALWWHPVHTQDAAHIWLRETTARLAAGLDDRPGRAAPAGDGTPPQITAARSGAGNAGDGPRR